MIPSKRPRLNAAVQILKANPLKTSDILWDYLKSLLLIPYYYGGSSPLMGLDCSGLVVEFLQAAGKMKHGDDATAQGLFHRYYVHKNTDTPKFGDLAFFGKTIDSISHVGICLNERLMIEAGGGTSGTKSLESAIQQNAFIKIRPIQYRKDFLCVVPVNIFE